MTTPAVQQDARNRAFRTFAQGLGIDVAVGLATVLLIWLPEADISTRQAWTVLGITVAKTLLQTIAAYVMRLKVAPVNTDPYHLED